MRGRLNARAQMSRGGGTDIPVISDSARTRISIVYPFKVKSTCREITDTEKSAPRKENRPLNSVS